MAHAPNVRGTRHKREVTTESVPQSYSVFAHLNAPNAHLYRRVLGAFVFIKERFQVHLRPDDVLDEIRCHGPHAASLTREAVTDALDALVDWGNLSASPDTGRVV